MKTSLTLLLAVIFLNLGCATSSPRTPLTPEQRAEQKAARLQAITEAAAFAGATVWLAKHPDDRAKFEMARDGLSMLTGGESTISQTQLADLVRKLPIKELQGEQGALYVGLAMIAYDAYLKEHIHIDGNANVRAAAVGLHSGLTRALGTP
jgi:hypothetical protein